jgi:hypothetical protein
LFQFDKGEADDVFVSIRLGKFGLKIDIEYGIAL